LEQRFSLLYRQPVFSLTLVYFTASKCFLVEVKFYVCALVFSVTVYTSQVSLAKI